LLKLKHNSKAFAPLTNSLFLVFMLWISFVPRLLAQNSEGNYLLLQNARLVIGDGNVFERGSILISEGQIMAVSESLAIEFPEQTEVVNLEGKTIIPALIDAHAHLGYQGADSWGAENYSVDNLIANLRQYAYYGFSAVFSAGSDPEELALGFQQEQSNETGIPGTSRFIFSAGMAPPGQGPNNQFLDHALQVADSMGMTILHGITNPQSARLAVREVAEKGIPFIKIWVDDRAGTQHKLEPENYRAIVDEARANNLSVFVHQQSAEDMPDLLDAKVSGFLHGRIGAGYTSAIAAQTKAADAFVIPNLGLGELRREAIGDDEFLSAILLPEIVAGLTASGSQREVNPARNEIAELELREGFARLLAAEVDIVLGTDAGAVPEHPFGYTGHRELEIFVRLGMTPMQAIISGTSAAAQILGLADLGLIKAGYSADLLILDNNPLSDIRNTRSINRVLLKGREINRNQLEIN
jgi:imidazolonepropionase-like amidohydrolase